MLTLTAAIQFQFVVQFRFLRAVSCVKVVFCSSLVLLSRLLFEQNQKLLAEKQIREEFAEIRQFLEKEEAAKLAQLAEEEEEKKHLMKKKTDNITRDILTFSHAVKAIDDEIANADSLFLQVRGIFNNSALTSLTSNADA